MPQFEFPVGSTNRPIINTGEEHLPCVLLIDISGSMSKCEQQLREAINAFREAIRENPQAAGIVEVCIITFADHAQVAVPFGPACDFEVPEIRCGGCTAMHEGVALTLSVIEARKVQYKEAGTNYKRPWIFMLTDGYPTDGGESDKYRTAFNHLVEAQEKKHCTFFSVGIGSDVDIPLLKSLRPDGMTFKASKEDFRDAFVWLANSISVTGGSQKGQKVVLPPVPLQITVDA